MHADRASEPILILWDVDQTLVSIKDGVSRSLYERAFEKVTGRTLGGLADMAGRTEQAIMVETLRLNGISEPQALFNDFYAALAIAAEELKGRMREVGVVLPGAREAIASCAARHTVQSAVTGNLRPIAITKLAALGLGDGLDFSVGGYGDDGSDRADLVRQARKRASEKYGHAFDSRRTVVIGDTPHDVRGAHDADALAVGIATGRSSADELRAAGADIVLATLTDFTGRCGEALGW
ncbi:phosphoglycolate phosphatase [Streptomyces himastatinicus ATCC 53653]|uniref:Phosphoglycolate phosphatase n=1 Tax=Streptomyces himastatinicus ATCC 53653 TaxID=457427 RepID=D9WMY3_9ACTN|nr:haloacid dehalogenase-like hydrolase [Streptomyces himastatinicus]EFL21693.1 phosphoglycolate phosphatase [Streptomyces himastatinicus ATCC 53653]